MPTENCHIDYTVLFHSFDVLAQQMPEELPQIEAAYRTVARGQGRVVGFHPTLPELPALFGMSDQGFNTSAAICQAGAHLRLPLWQTPDIQPRLLETTLLQPCHRA